MACKDGSCGVGGDVKIVKSVDIPTDVCNLIERYYYEYSRTMNLMKDFYMNDFELSPEKYEKLRLEYFDAFATHQMMLTQTAGQLFTKEELYKYGLRLDFSREQLDLVIENNIEEN